MREGKSIRFFGRASLLGIYTGAVEKKRFPFPFNSPNSMIASLPKSPQAVSPTPSFPILGESFHERQAIVVLDEDGTVQHISRQARELLSLETGTIAGRSFFGHVHPDHLNRVKWDLVQMVGRGKQTVTWLLRLRTGLGPWQWFKLQAVNYLRQKGLDGIVLWVHERGRLYH